MANPTVPGPLHGGFFGGAFPSPPDNRDHLFGVAAMAQLPTAVISLPELMPPCTDQDHTNACTAHTITKIRTALARKWHLSQGQDLNQFTHEVFSELWEYFWTRKEEDTPDTQFPKDAGAHMRQMCDAMLRHGAVLEGDLPWNPQTASEDVKRDLSNLTPPSARFFGISGFQRVGGPGMDTVGSIVAALQANNPVAAGFAIFRSFFTGQSGHSPLPDPQGGDQRLGGHAVPIYAFIPDVDAPGGGWFKWRGSWGPQFGDNGDGYLSVSYIASEHLWDAWTIS
jgi:hypothetical protein